MKKPTFKPIDLDTNSATCLKFRIDSYVESYGGPEKFYADGGEDGSRYLKSLAAKIQIDPWSVVHVWDGEEVIGQIELGQFRPDPSIGYVNLYYLKDCRRGTGLGIALDDYVSQYFRTKGTHKIRLTVSSTNLRAIGFYKKCGWLDIGPRTDYPGTNFMEKSLF